MTPRLDGAVAQLGERRVRNAEVRGSTPLGSTSPPDASRKSRFPFRAGLAVCNRQAADLFLKGVQKYERETAGGVKKPAISRRTNGRLRIT
jgi:hypothetical protein